MFAVRTSNHSFCVCVSDMNVQKWRHASKIKRNFSLPKHRHLDGIFRVKGKEEKIFLTDQ